MRGRHVLVFLRSRLGATTAVVAALVVIAAFTVTNIRISERPALSANQVNGIVNQKVSTAMSQLQSPSSARRQRVQGCRVRDRHNPVDTQRCPRQRRTRHRVIVDKQGDILTALHVVQGASSIKVSFADGTRRRAPSSTAADTGNDIAVLTPSGCRR